MPISDAMEAKMAEARAARNKQDRKHPMLINVEDGRLVPNVPLLGGRKADPAKGITSVSPHPKYRVYMGDPRASREERLRLLALSGVGARTPVMDSGDDESPVAPPFDIAKASREELVKFAKDTYDQVIDEDGKTHMMTLRAVVRNLATAAGDLG